MQYMTLVEVEVKCQLARYLRAFGRNSLKPGSNGYDS